MLVATAAVDHHPPGLVIAPGTCEIGLTPEVIDRLRLTLARKDKAELKDNIGYAAAWMTPVIGQVAGREAS